MKKERLFISLLVILFINTTLHAQYILEGDSLYKNTKIITVTATRYEKNIFETCIPAVVIDADLRQRNYTTFFDALNENPGITSTEAGPWSMKPVIRGLAGSHVLSLINGMKMNVLRSYGSHAPLIDINQIERIEVIKGPASVMYGSDAVAGVVNIITREAPDFTNKFIIKTGFGLMYNSVNNQSSEYVSLEGSGARISFLTTFDNRIADNLNTPSGELGNTGFKGKFFSADFNFKLSSRQILKLKTELNRMNDVGVPINPFAYKAGFDKYYRDSFQAGYYYNPGNKRWSQVKAKFFYQRGERNFIASIYNVPKGSLYANNELSAHRIVNSSGFDVQGGYFIFRNNLLTAGVDGFLNKDNTERTSDAFITNSSGTVVKDPPEDNTPPTPKAFREGLGIFIEDEWTVSSLLTLTMGTRYDVILSHADPTPNTLVEKEVNETDNDISASIGAIYRLSETLHLFGNAGRAFKAPTLQERFFKGTAQVGYLTGNPDLVSETSFNIDAGIKYYSRSVKAEFSLFRNHINNYIVMEPVTASLDTFKYSNIGDAMLLGGEFFIRVKPYSWMTLFTNTSYVYGEDRNAKNPLPMIPPLNGTIGMKIESPKALFWFETKVNMFSTQNRTADNEKSTPGYVLTDITFGTNLSKLLHTTQGYYATLMVTNLFNVSYRNHLSTVTWWDGPGRNISISIRKIIN